MALKLDPLLVIGGGVALYESYLIFTGSQPFFQPDPIYNFLKGVLNSGGCAADLLCDVGKVKRGKPFCDCVPNPCGCDEGTYVLLDGTVKCILMGRPEMICGNDQIKRGPPHCDCITVEWYERPYKQCDTSVPEYTLQQFIDLGIDVVDYKITVDTSCTACGCTAKTIAVAIDLGDILGADILTTLGYLKV